MGTSLYTLSRQVKHFFTIDEGTDHTDLLHFLREHMMEEGREMNITTAGRKMNRHETTEPEV
jgi:hypothetical protein